MKIELTGKVAIVTGAASGIGLATVQEFLESDIAGLVAVDLAPELPGTLAEMLKHYPDRLRYIEGDVSTELATEKFVQCALNSFGRIDIVLNNAAISVVKPIHLHTEAEWDRVFDVNVKSMYWVSKYIVPVMQRQGGGVILNTGSISGHVGLKSQGAYGPSKGAVHLLTKQMAIEYASSGIRVNAIALGTVDTPIVQWSAQQTADPEAFVAGLRNSHPIGRIATAREAAKFFTYLASDDASFFTGAILSMDGGFTAQ